MSSSSSTSSSASTEPSAPELAALLCSRLCHDLLSPVGALTNGLELLSDEEDPEMRQRCFELLEQSARSSADKLKFFRLAFGAAGGFGEMVETDEPRAVVDALVGANERVEAKWRMSAGKLPKDAVKVLLNFSHIALDALVRGGTLEIGVESGSSADAGAGEGAGATNEIVVRASGPKIAFDETVGQALEGTLPADQLSGRTAPAYMLHLLAQNIGGRLQYQRSDDALLLGAVLPQPEGLIG